MLEQIDLRRRVVLDLPPVLQALYYVVAGALTGIRCEIGSQVLAKDLKGLHLACLCDLEFFERQR